MLRGRVAIVTGAGRGIGAAIARELAAQGARVVVNDLGAELDGEKSAQDPGDAVVEEIRARGGEAVVDRSDVADYVAAGGLIDTALSRYSRLDILVNVAGIVRDRMIFNMSENDFDAVVRVHLKGTFNTTRHASKYWHDNPGSGYRLLNFTSGAALFGSPAQPNYAAAKLGIVGLTQSCANSLYKYGVMSAVISPTAATRMTETMPRQVAEKAGLAFGAEMTPENVAAGVAYVCGPDSGWLNGQVIAIRGRQMILFKPFTESVHVVSDSDLTPSSAGRLMESAFRPAVQGTRPFAAPKMLEL